MNRVELMKFSGLIDLMSCGLSGTISLYEASWHNNRT